MSEWFELLHYVAYPRLPPILTRTKLTPCNTVLPYKLTVAQLVMKLSSSKKHQGSLSLSK
jgi:hypothetical protein